MIRSQEKETAAFLLFIFLLAGTPLNLNWVLSTLATNGHFLFGDVEFSRPMLLKLKCAHKSSLCVEGPQMLSHSPSEPWVLCSSQSLGSDKGDGHRPDFG